MSRKESSSRVVKSSWLGTVLLVVTGPGCILLSGNPPTVPQDCYGQLHAAGLAFKKTQHRPGKIDGEAVCKVPQAIKFSRLPSGLRVRKGAKVNCDFALRLVQLDKILQAEADKHLQVSARVIDHMGTYACRKIKAWPSFTSEHAFANAIDLSGVVLSNGVQTTVARDYPKGRQPRNSKERFWVSLASRLYDEDVFSVVLTPNHDMRHWNHLHLDGAPYRSNGL